MQGSNAGEYCLAELSEQTDPTSAGCLTNLSQDKECLGSTASLCPNSTGYLGGYLSDTCLATDTLNWREK